MHILAKTGIAFAGTAAIGTLLTAATTSPTSPYRGAAARQSSQPQRIADAALAVAIGGGALAGAGAIAGSFVGHARSGALMGAAIGTGLILGVRGTDLLIPRSFN